MRIHSPVAVAAALALLVVPSSAVEGSSGRSAPVAAPSAGAPATRITLITGDRIEVARTDGGPDRVRLLPGSPSRVLATSYHDGHTYAVPAAATWRCSTIRRRPPVGR